MSSEFTVTAACGTTRTFQTRQKAEDGMDTHAALCEECGDGDVEITTGDGGSTPEVVDDPETTQTKNQTAPEPASEDYAGDLPDEGPSVDEDPLVWMPDEFTDTIDGTVAINRKGFEVLAHHYDIQCRTELCESLTNQGRVTFKATATDADGDEYSAFGSAGKARDDDPGLLVEMADTRAYKRAVSRATGVGMVAVEELQEGFSNE